MRTILHPNFDPWKDEKGRSVRERRIPSTFDYVTVPAVSLYGAWSIVDLVPFEQLGQLAVFRKALERK